MTARVPVWDRVVRLLHWSLVLCMLAAWLSTLAGLMAIGSWHQPAGYGALAIVLLRLGWGLVSPRGSHARWSGFVRTPGHTWGYLRLLLRGQEPRHIGHNPLGGWMVLALIVCVLALAGTGWLYTTDRFWGDEAVERVHLVLAWAMGGLVALHVAGVAFTSLRHRENLVRAMVDGEKPAPGPQDVG